MFKCLNSPLFLNLWIFWPYIHTDRHQLHATIQNRSIFFFTRKIVCAFFSWFFLLKSINIFYAFFPYMYEVQSLQYKDATQMYFLEFYL